MDDSVKPTAALLQSSPSLSPETHSLIYHQSTNCNIFATYLSSFNLGILFIEEGNKARSKMTAVAFRRKNEPYEVSRRIVMLEMVDAIKLTLVIETLRIDHFRTKFGMPPRQKVQLTQCC